MSFVQISTNVLVTLVSMEENATTCRMLSAVIVQPDGLVSHVKQVSNRT